MLVFTSCYVYNSFANIIIFFNWSVSSFITRKCFFSSGRAALIIFCHVTNAFEVESLFHPVRYHYYHSWSVYRPLKASVSQLRRDLTRRSTIFQGARTGKDRMLWKGTGIKEEEKVNFSIFPLFFAYAGVPFPLTFELSLLWNSLVKDSDFWSSDRNNNFLWRILLNSWSYR